jgi:hypothetical protein
MERLRIESRVNNQIRMMVAGMNEPTHRTQVYHTSSSDGCRFL